VGRLIAVESDQVPRLDGLQDSVTVRSASVQVDGDVGRPGRARQRIETHGRDDVVDHAQTNQPGANVGSGRNHQAMVGEPASQAAQRGDTGQCVTQPEGAQRENDSGHGQDGSVEVATTNSRISQPTG
jgi:hypothetical protein